MAITYVELQLYFEKFSKSHKLGAPPLKGSQEEGGAKHSPLSWKSKQRAWKIYRNMHTTYRKRKQGMKGVRAEHPLANYERCCCSFKSFFGQTSQASAQLSPVYRATAVQIAQLKDFSDFQLFLHAKKNNKGVCSNQAFKPKRGGRDYKLGKQLSGAHAASNLV